jgi:hypothetical protein
MGFNVRPDLFQRAAARSARLAALAGSKAGGARSICRREKADVGAQRTLAAACWATEDAGCFDRVEERGGWVASENLFPGGLRIDGEYVRRDAGCCDLEIALHENYRRRFLSWQAIRFLLAITI